MAVLRHKKAVQWEKVTKQTDTLITIKYALSSDIYGNLRPRQIYKALELNYGNVPDIL